MKYLNKKESIISLGGGGFINDKIREKVLSECVSVWLNVNLKTIYKRLKNSKIRPLANNNNQNNLDKLFLERKKIYSLADHEINCDNLDINQISNKIIKLYEGI
jgi:shikimate kinase